MTARNCEFFFMPQETVDWLQRVMADMSLWAAITLHRVDDRLHVDSWLRKSEEITPDLFISEREVPCQLFLGHEDFSQFITNDITAGREIDYPPSYTVLVDPPVLVEARNILLEGRIAISGKEWYEDMERYEALLKVYKDLVKRLKRSSDRRFTISQTLANGKTKLWRSTQISQTVVQKWEKGLQLKQHLGGAVYFDVATR